PSVSSLRAKRSNPFRYFWRYGLLRRCAPRKKQLVEWVSGRLRAWLQLDGEAEFFEARDQSACFELDWPAIEVGRAEVVMFCAILEDVIDRGEDRGCDGANRFLR